MCRRFQFTRLSQFGTLRTLFAVTALVGAVTTKLDAEPITFRFDATVTDALAGSPFALPFSYEVGEAISGKLTFDPQDSEPKGKNAIESIQPFQFEFVIDGARFGTSTYAIEVFNDSIVLDTDLGLVDTMIVACSPSSSQNCSPEWISVADSEPFAITTRLKLTGDETTLNAPIIGSDVELWNSFLLERSLTITFDNQTNGSMLLHASVGSFVVVPEQSTFVVVIGIFVASFFSRWTIPRFERGMFKCCAS